MVHREVMNRHKVDILKRMADHVIATGRNEIPLKALANDINDYNNCQKLRYHACIFKIKRGTWGITSHGWDFMKGEKELPRRIYVEDNAIVSRSDDMVNIREIVTAPFFVYNTFEYQDENGVVIRPVEKPVTQLGLL